MFFFPMPGRPIRNLATYPPPVQTYAFKAFGPSFAWVYHAKHAAVQSLDNFEKIDTSVTMNQQKFLQVCEDQKQGMYNAFGLRGLAMPLPSCYSSL